MWNQAISAFEQALPIFEKHYGDENSTTLGCRSQLAKAYNAAGRFYEGKEFVSSLVSSQEKPNPNSNPNLNPNPNSNPNPLVTSQEKALGENHV